ncbi:MAG: M14-type cytosolic carboxypeptidase [Bryobacterales bacterium]
MFALLLLAATLHTDFVGGSLGNVEWVTPNHARCPVEGESDQDGRNRQANWYYFRIDGAKGQELTLDLVDLVGEYNYQPGSHAVSKDTYPVYSYDDRNWRHFESVEWDDKEIRLRLRFTPEQDRVWIAHVPPYTNDHLARLIAEARQHPHFRQEVSGKTVDGRDMPLFTVTDPEVPLEEKKVVWLMFRQHSWETGSSWAGEGAVRYVLSDAPEAVRIRRETVFKIFPMADPDGVARGGVRFNAHGYDLNRNWDAVNENLMPEIAAQRKAVLDWVDSGRPVHLFLSLHNTETSEYLEGPVEYRELSGRFRKLLVARTTFHPTRPEPRDAASSTTPGKPGRMTVNQGLFHERRIPAMLMEQMVGFNPKLGRRPTIQDRLDFGAGLVRAMWLTVTVGE